VSGKRASQHFRSSEFSGNPFLSSNLPISAIELACAHVKGRHPRAIDAKDHSQVSFNNCAVNRVPRFRRKFMDFVSPERRMEGIGFKDLPSSPDRFFLRWRKPVKISKISLQPDIDNSRARGLLIKRRFHGNETLFLEILESVDEILGDITGPKLAHALDETFALTLRQRFDFFNDLFCGHVFGSLNRLSIHERL